MNNLDDISPVPFGRYTLLDRIGVGGMAEIFRGVTEGVAGFKKVVAVKRILSHLAEDEVFRGMFTDEAKLAAMIEHPNVVQIFDLGETNGRLFIAMEFVEGMDFNKVLRTFARRGERIPQPLALFVVSEFLRGLDCAHSMHAHDGSPLDLIHRDVSPSNVLMSFDGTVKLSDFGIAKAAHRTSHTRTGSIKGKLPYMSPELAAGESIDRRSDLWASGVVLWEALSGRRLFRAKSDFKLIAQITRGEVIPITNVMPDLDPMLTGIVNTALAVDRDRRYQSAADMADAIEEVLSLQSRRPTISDLQRFMRENFAEEYAAARAFKAQLDTILARKPAASTGPLPPLEAGIPSSVDIDLNTRAPSSELVTARSKTPWLIGGGVAALGLIAAIGLALMPSEPPTLEVVTQPPGAAVVIDGVPRADVTPVRIRSLPAGPHKIALNLQGYEPEMRSLELVSGKKQLVNLTLKQRPAPARPAAAVDAGVDAGEHMDRHARARPHGRQPSKPRVSRAPASLTITALPWAYVTIDGTKLPRPTPILGYALKAGSHTIVVENPQLNKRHSKRIRLKPRQTKKLHFKMN